MNQTIILREYKNSDLQEYYNCVNDEKLKEFLPYIYCNNMQVADSILRKKIEAQKRDDNNIRYAIEEIQTNHIIGEISAHIRESKARILCFINSKYRGKSYVKEAVFQLTEILKSKNANITALEVQIAINNIAAKKAFEKLDFKYKNEGRTYKTYEKEI